MADKTEYDNSWSGAIFSQSRKNDGDSDVSGSQNINGVEFYADGWLVNDKTFRLRFKRKGDGNEVWKGEIGKVGADTPKHPTWKGSVSNEDGETLYVAGWKRTAKKSGNNFMSLSLSLPRSQEVEGEGHKPIDNENKDAPF